MRPIYLDTGTVAQASLRDKPRLAAVAGYGGLELWHHDVDPSSLSPVARSLLRERYGVELTQVDETATFDPHQLRSECTARGLVIDGVIPPLDFAMRWHDDLGTEMHALISAELPKYHALGVRYVVLPMLGEAGSLERTAEILAELGELMRPFGILAAFEPIGHVRKASRADEACRVIELSGRDANVGLVIDVFHFFQAQNTLRDLQSLPSERIVTVHLNDAMDLPLRELSGARHRVHPGEGIFDAVGFCRTLDAIGYRGPCAVEVLNEGYRRLDAAHVARRSFEATLSVLTAAEASLTTLPERAPSP
jgi:sugar phosphate isomerase/epimerase